MALLEPAPAGTESAPLAGSAPHPLPDDDARPDGDVSIHLEDLVENGLAAPPAVEKPTLFAPVRVELVGPHMRLTGVFDLGRFRRLSDFLNHHVGMLGLHDVTVLRRNGEPTKVTADRLWVSPDEVTIFGQLEDLRTPAPPEFRILKVPHPMIYVTQGHTLTGELHGPEGGDLASLVESVDPSFVPLTDVRTRSLADRRIIARYPFALLNRRHVVATTELAEGLTGRRVL